MSTARTRSTLVALVCVVLFGAGKPTRTVVVTGTLEAALGQPLVHVQLKDGKRVLTARPTELDRLLGRPDGDVRSFTAFLDTGSSAFVLSKSTADRFGLEAVPEAAFHEFGLHGAVRMGVSRPCAVGLGDFSGVPTETPSEFITVVREAAFELNRAEAAEGLALFGAAIDVVGMPAIKRLVIEIDPTVMSEVIRSAPDRPGQDLLERIEMLSSLPAVRLHSARRRPRSIDVEIQLEYVDYNRRRHPANQGPLPDLASNPMITGVVSEHGGKSFTGDWLLDTGAATSIISTGHATALGLCDAAGTPTREPDFTVVLSGIRGESRPALGFVLERVRIPAASKRTLEFQGVHVIVGDVGIELPDGDRFVLQGVLGMNLLLPSVTGLGRGDITSERAAPFRRVWIDGPRHTLSLDLP
ncbi:MAG: aspartyl protease family protein [Planctomycetota bacterium]|jgi:hypothetical protein